MRIGDKAAHVRERFGDDPGSHHCHWPGCGKHVPPAMWGCRRHWFKLPLGLRNRIWAAYRPGQEDRKDPSPEYVEVAREVQEWIDQHESRQPGLFNESVDRT